MGVVWGGRVAVSCFLFFERGVLGVWRWLQIGEFWEGRLVEKLGWGREGGSGGAEKRRFGGIKG